MTTAQIVILIAMTCYLLFMLVVGYKFADQNESMGDFYIGGRKLGPLVTAMSAEASDMSSWLLMGLPGVAYLTGVSEAGWTAIGLAIGTYLNWLIVAKRLRRYSASNNSITIPEFLSNRFGDSGFLLAMISACIIIIFFVPYTASGFAACGKLFSSLFGIDYHMAMIVSAFVIISYTTMGGFLAASTTDFVQSIIMSLALLIVLLFGVVQAGGIGAVAANAKSMAGYLSFTKGYDPATGGTTPYGFLPIVSTLAWGLGYFGMPHVLLRFMAIEDDSKLGLSRRVASVWVVISMAVATLIGIIGNAMSVAGRVPALSGNDSETIIVKISDLLSSYGILPAFIAGVILSGILACTMSTADSQLLAASSSVTNDILIKFFGKKYDERTQLFISRTSLILIAVIGIFFAWNPDSSVFRIVSFAWAGFGATFGPVMLLALFWKRANRQGAMAGLITGGIMVFFWKFLVRPIGGAFNIYELLPAFIVAAIVNVVVSLRTPEPDAALVEEFERVSSM